MQSINFLNLWSQVRREAATALYRLCSGGEYAVLAPLLQLLLEHLPRAADMRLHAPTYSDKYHHEVSKMNCITCVVRFNLDCIEKY